MVAQYKSNVEASRDRLKAIVEYVMWRSRRVALEEVHGWGFDLLAEIENTNRLKVEAKKLAYPEDEEDSEGSSGFEGEKDPNGLGDEAGSGENQAS